MKESKGNVVITIILIIVILLLIGFIVYDKVILKEENIVEQPVENNISEEKKENELNNNITNKNNNEYTYEKISALYKYSDDEVGYYLYLWENGTFKYEYSDNTAPRGYLGNYTISDNNINLNYLFSTGSDTGLYVTKGNKTLIINKDNSITDNSTTLEQRKVNLKKATMQEEKKYLDAYNFYNIMNNADLINHQ